MSNKHISDVTVKLKLIRLKNNSTDNVAILTSGTDNKVHSYLYDDLSELDGTFDENSSVYNLVEKAFDVDGYQGNIEVIQAPNSDNNSPLTANAQANQDGSTSVKGSNMNRFAYALSQHIYDGFHYVVADGLSEKDLEAVSDYLYQVQRAALITQFKSKDDARVFYTHSSQNKMNDKQFNTDLAPIIETSDRQPAIQLAVYATMNAPIDLMHVGNLSEFQPDDDITLDDINSFDSLNDGATFRANCIVDKADDFMLLNGKSCDHNYIDQFINTVITKDKFEYDLQKQLNSFKMNHFDDKTIGKLQEKAERTAAELMANGFLDNYKITKTPRAKISNNQVEKRHYDGLYIDAQVATSIDSVDVHLNMIE